MKVLVPLLHIILFHPNLYVNSTTIQQFDTAIYNATGNYELNQSTTCTRCDRVQTGDRLQVNFTGYTLDNRLKYNVSYFRPSTLTAQSHLGRFVYTYQVNQDPKILRSWLFPTFIIEANWSYWQTKVESTPIHFFNVSPSTIGIGYTIKETSKFTNTTYERTYDFYNVGLLREYVENISVILNGRTYSDYQRLVLESVNSGSSQSVPFPPWLGFLLLVLLVVIVLTGRKLYQLNQRRYLKAVNENELFP